MKALIVGNGSLLNNKLLIERYEWADLIISADGGTMHLMRAGLVPHIVLGDLDSISASCLEEIGHRDIEILTFPVKKDFTDMELAMDLALERGATELVILGATGSRMDHTISNIFLLYKLLLKGVTGCIEDEHNRIYLVNDTITIKKQEDHKVSLLSLTSSVEGLTTKGLSYPLKDAGLKFGTSLGISNEFQDDTATITLKNGLLLVFVSRD